MTTPRPEREGVTGHMNYLTPTVVKRVAKPRAKASRAPVLLATLRTIEAVEESWFTKRDILELFAEAQQIPRGIRRIPRRGANDPPDDVA